MDLPNTALLVQLAGAAVALLVLVLTIALVCAVVVLGLEDLGLRRFQNRIGLRDWVRHADELSPEVAQWGWKRIRFFDHRSYLFEGLRPHLHLPLSQLLGLLGSRVQAAASGPRLDNFALWFAAMGGLRMDDDIRHLVESAEEARPVRSAQQEFISDSEKAAHTARAELQQVLALYSERALDALQAQLIRSQTLIRFAVAYLLTGCLFIGLRVLMTSVGQLLVVQTALAGLLVLLVTLPLTLMLCRILERLAFRE